MGSISSIEDDSAFMARMKRFLDRLTEVAGIEDAHDKPKPFEVADDSGDIDEPISMAPRPVRQNTRLNVGPRTMQVLEFIYAERAAGRPFPTLNQITTHMKWPRDGAHRQAKDALNRLQHAKMIVVPEKKKRRL